MQTVLIITSIVTVLGVTSAIVNVCWLLSTMKDMADKDARIKKMEEQLNKLEQAQLKREMAKHILNSSYGMKVDYADTDSLDYPPVKKV